VVIVATTTTVEARAATVAAAGDQKEYDNEKPNHVVVIENIAETIHSILPSPKAAISSKSKFERKAFAFLSVTIV
jgi:hypothetical protein